MSQTAPAAERTPLLETGRIQAVLGDDCIIASPSGLIRARRAAGCLLEPQPGDKVLALIAREDSYVLHVLERKDTPARVILPSQTSLETLPRQPDGQPGGLTLRADAISMKGKDMRLESDSLLASAGALDLRANVLTVTGRFLNRHFTAVRDVCAHAFQRVGRSFGLYGKRIQRVDDVLETTAGRVRLSAREAMRIRARDADVRAEESVSVDGNRINIG